MSRVVTRLLPVVGLALAGAALLSACGGEGGESPGSAMAERSMRFGQDDSANAVVYEGELPPSLSDLLNPSRAADTPAENLLVFPVHPDGELIGSWLLREADGAHTVQLFYDVVEATPAQVADTISPQLDSSTWQIVSRGGNRAFMQLQFESTGVDEITGVVFAAPAPPGGSYSLVVERDGSEVTLEVSRASTLPDLEANLSSSLRVQRVHPGLARTAGLRDGDQIIRVGDTEVTTRRELQEALDALARGTGRVALTYILEFAPPLRLDEPEFIPYDLDLPADFPAARAFDGLMLEEYLSEFTPQGQVHLALFLSEDRDTTVLADLRGALEASGWEILASEPGGLATMVRFEHQADGLEGAARIDAFDLDQSLTEVLVQIQSGASAGN